MSRAQVINDGAVFWMEPDSGPSVNVVVAQVPPRPHTLDVARWPFSAAIGQQTLAVSSQASTECCRYL
jgi:hypothetical protein